MKKEQIVHDLTMAAVIGEIAVGNIHIGDYNFYEAVVRSYEDHYPHFLEEMDSRMFDDE